MKATFFITAILFSITPVISAQVAPAGKEVAKTISPLIRHYQDGESLAYHMKATNQGRDGTLRYEADARGVVKKSQSGFLEEYAWSGLSYNGQAVPLSANPTESRQQVSLDPASMPLIPDFTKVNPALIGPIADFMTFYVDLWLAEKQGTLIHAGDHAFVKNGRPNSWADGKKTVLGNDAIDFDLTLLEVNDHTSKLVVRHVPPAQPQIQLPAEWMHTPVADTANNWAEVSKTDDGKYVAGVGKEIFDVELTIDRTDGKILSATMDNPVTVLSRTCVDAELSKCGEPEHYTIRRQIELKLAP